MNQADYRKIISGKKKGIGIFLFRCLLCCISLPYSAIIRLRNFFYDKKIFKSYKIDIAVISVGNITAGGTGKTPVVSWLVKQLFDKYKCAIITRGYKSTIKGSDEANTLARSYPDVPVIVNPNRIKGAEEAIKIHGSEVLILDDGFQHRKLARDIDIITIDATCPFGHDKILPSGFLREPVSSIKRIHAAVITRIDNINSTENIEAKLKSYNESLIIARSIHKPCHLVTSDKETLQPEQLNGKKVFAFCGIGNPKAFFNTVSSLGAKITDIRIFDDHYSYNQEDIEKIHDRALKANAELILTTEKDFIKIEQEWIQNSIIDFTYLTIEIDLVNGTEKITELIEKTIESKIASST